MRGRGSGKRLVSLFLGCALIVVGLIGPQVVGRADESQWSNSKFSPEKAFVEDGKTINFSGTLTGEARGKIGTISAVEVSIDSSTEESKKINATSINYDETSGTLVFSLNTSGKSEGEYKISKITYDVVSGESITLNPPVTTFELKNKPTSATVRVSLLNGNEVITGDSLKYKLTVDNADMIATVGSITLKNGESNSLVLGPGKDIDQSLKINSNAAIGTYEVAANTNVECTTNNQYGNVKLNIPLANKVEVKVVKNTTPPATDKLFTLSSVGLSGEKQEYNAGENISLNLTLNNVTDAAFDGKVIYTYNSSNLEFPFSKAKGETGRKDNVNVTTNLVSAPSISANATASYSSVAGRVGAAEYSSANVSSTVTTGTAPSFTIKGSGGGTTVTPASIESAVIDPKTGLSRIFDKDDNIKLTLNVKNVTNGAIDGVATYKSLETNKTIAFPLKKDQGGSDYRDVTFESTIKAPQLSSDQNFEFISVSGIGVDTVPQTIRNLAEAKFKINKFVNPSDPKVSNASIGKSEYNSGDTITLNLGLTNLTPGTSIDGKAYFITDQYSDIVFELKKDGSAITSSSTTVTATAKAPNIITGEMTFTLGRIEVNNTDLDISALTTKPSFKVKEGVIPGTPTLSTLAIGTPYTTSGTTTIPLSATIASAGTTGGVANTIKYIEIYYAIDTTPPTKATLYPVSGSPTLFRGDVARQFTNGSSHTISLSRAMVYYQAGSDTSGNKVKEYDSLTGLITNNPLRFTVSNYTPSPVNPVNPVDPSNPSTPTNNTAVNQRAANTIIAMANNGSATLDYTASPTVSANIFDLLRGTQKTVNLLAPGGFIWTFNGATVTGASKQIDLRVTATTLAATGATNSFPLVASLTGNRPVVILNFANNGVLPGTATITIPVSQHTSYIGTSNIYQYFVNESTRRLEKVGGPVTVSSGNTVTMAINHNSTYILTYGEVAGATAPTTPTNNASDVLPIYNANATPTVTTPTNTTPTAGTTVNTVYRPGSTSPKTGDAFRMYVWVGMLLIGAFLVFASVLWPKKKEKSA